MKFLEFKPYFWNYEQDKFDGIKFENLVAELLLLEYPALHPGEEWQRTKKSWDGKKDFYQYFLNNGKRMLRWAECKAYQKALSLNILAPTLIMSTLRKANEVIIFSYSRLNREAINELQEFAQAHHMCIRIYDDEKLEQLILKYRDNDSFDFSTFFPNAGVTSFLLDSDFPIEYGVTIYVHNQNAVYSVEQLRKQKLKVNELFELRISLVNKSLSLQQVRLEFDMESNSAYRFLDCGSRQTQCHYSVTLQGGEVSSVSVPMKVTGYAPRVLLPQLRLSCAGREMRLSQVSFVGSWLLETPYFGDYKRLEQESNTTMALYETVFTVFGSSGVGKTRFLREMYGRRVLIGRKCLWSDAVHTDGRAMIWLQQILSKLYALPRIHIQEYSPESFPEVEARIVTDVLYDAGFTLTQDKIETIACAIIKALQKQDVLLIVDNIQDFDDYTVRILNAILNYIADAPGTHLLLCFNTDLVYRQETALNLFRRLKQLWKEDREHYQHREIAGLSPDDVELFIRSCFSNQAHRLYDEKQTWQTLCRRIANITKNNPLYLEQFLLHLCEHGVLRTTGDHLYIFDDRRMSDCLSGFPDTFKELLERRWSLLRKSGGIARKDLERVLRLVCFFEKIPMNLIGEMALNEEAIEYLIGAGFLRQASELTFYHPLIEMFFQQKLSALSKADARLCARALRACGLKKIYSSHYFYCCLRYQMMQSRLADSAINELVDGRVPPRLVQAYGDTLFSAFGQGMELPAGSPKKLLLFYIAYGGEQKRYRPMAEILKFYESVYQKYLVKFPEFSHCGKVYFAFIKEYMNALLTEHRNSTVVALGTELLNRLDEFPFADEREKKKARATLLNRMHVAVDRLQPPADGVPDSPYAQELLQEALDISYEICDPDRIIQNEIDFGNVFYLFGGPPEAAAQHWMKAVQTWEAHRDEVPLWEGGVFFHQALAHVLLHEWEQAESSIQKIMRFHERTLHNPYYYVKGLVLRALLYLICEKPLSEIIHALDEAEDACIAGGYKGVFPVCAHIRAVVYDHLGNNAEFAADFYEKALTQYIKRCESACEEERIMIVLLTISLALRRLRGAKRYSCVGSLRSAEVSKKLLRILDADEQTWQSILRESPPKGILYIEEKGISYPCV